MSIFDYKGPRGHLKDVEIIYESNRWDGPLSGVCRVEGHFLYFDIMKSESLDNGDLWIPYNDTFGWPRERIAKECEEFNETPEEYIKDMDVIRFFHTYYVPQDVLNQFILSQLYFEWTSSDVWGTILGTKEAKDGNNKFKEKTMQLEVNERYKKVKELKEENHLNESNIMGYFTHEDIIKNHRRIDCMDIESERNEIKEMVNFTGV